MSIIGRAREGEMLASRLDEVRARGRGQAVLISGDAGLGKTTVLDELLRTATDDDVVILRGRAFPLDANVPYAPLVSALGNHLRRQPDEERERLVAGLGALGLIFDELPVDATVMSADPALQRTRLYESVARLVARLCDTAPVLLALDDLHWADQSSTELVQHLTRDLSVLPLLIVATARPVELEAHTWTRAFLRSLRQSGDLLEVVLEPFDRHDLDALVVQELGSPAEDDVLDFLEARSAGVPFYADVLLRDAVERGAFVVDDGGCRLVEATGPPPGEIRDEIRERFDNLSDDARLVINVLAVSGDPLTTGVLRDVVGAIDGDATDDLGLLIRRGIVRESAEPPARCELAHPLYTEVAYADLTTTDRQRLHQSLASALDRSSTTGTNVSPMSLARHWRGAGDLGDTKQLAGALLKAARLARRQSALDDAAQLLTEALPVVRRTYGKQEVAEAMVELGSTWYSLGEPAAAAELLTEAVNLLRPLGDDEMTAAALVRLAEVNWAMGETDVGAEQTSEALLLREKLDDDDALAGAIFQTMVFRARAGGDEFDFDPMATSLEEIAERSPSTTTRMIASLARSTALLANNDWKHVEASVEESRTLTAASGDPQMMYRAASYQIETTMALGDLSRLERATAESSALLDELGLAVFDHRAASTRFFTAMLTAQWGAAHDHLIEWQDFAERASIPRAIAVAWASGAWLQALSGDTEAADSSLAHARRAVHGLSSPDVPALTVIATCSAFIGRDLDDWPRAATALPELLASFSAGFPIVSVAARGYAHLGRDDVEAALDVATMLESCAPPGTRPIAEGARLRGMARQRQGDDGSAELRAAAETFDRLGMGFDAARTRLELRNDPDATASALELFQRCGARPLAERAQQLLGDAKPRRKTGAAVATETGLTPREREVAGLVAEGLTNAQIAERLFISVRTVTSHLDHAYTRLGISSRAALATYITAGERAGA